MMQFDDVYFECVGLNDFCIDLTNAKEAERSLIVEEY